MATWILGGVVVAEAGLEGFLERRRRVCACGGATDAGQLACSGRGRRACRELRRWALLSGLSTCGGGLNVLQLALQILIDLSSLAIRVFSSSTESLSDWTWPEAVSILPLSASFCWLIFCCRAFTVCVIWLALSAVCSTRCCRTPNRVSRVDWRRCTISRSCCTWVCSAMISFEAACARTGAGRGQCSEDSRSNENDDGV